MFPKVVLPNGSEESGLAFTPQYLDDYQAAQARPGSGYQSAQIALSDPFRRTQLTQPNATARAERPESSSPRSPVLGEDGSVPGISPLNLGDAKARADQNYTLRAQRGDDAPRTD